jgi:hypothetical protein
MHESFLRIIDRARLTAMPHNGSLGSAANRCAPDEQDRGLPYEPSIFR